MTIAHHETIPFHPALAVHQLKEAVESYLQSLACHVPLFSDLAKQRPPFVLSKIETDQTR